MKFRTFVVLFGLIVLPLITASCGSMAAPAPTPTPVPTPTPSDEAGKALLANKCNSCHPLAVVEGAKHDEAGWKYVTDNMIGKGALLSPEQQALVVDYLARKYPE